MPTPTMEQHEATQGFLAALERLPGVRLALLALEPDALGAAPAPRQLLLGPAAAAGLRCLSGVGLWRELPPAWLSPLGLYPGHDWRVAAIAGLGYALVEVDDASKLPGEALGAVLDAWTLAWPRLMALPVRRLPLALAFDGLLGAPI